MSPVVTRSKVGTIDANGCHVNSLKIVWDEDYSLVWIVVIMCWLFTAPFWSRL